jgi:hypothetical protein
LVAADFERGWFKRQRSVWSVEERISVLFFEHLALAAELSHRQFVGATADLAPGQRTKQLAGEPPKQPAFGPAKIARLKIRSFEWASSLLESVRGGQPSNHAFAAPAQTPTLTAVSPGMQTLSEVLLRLVSDMAVVSNPRCGDTEEVTELVAHWRPNCTGLRVRAPSTPSPPM